MNQNEFWQHAMNWLIDNAPNGISSEAVLQYLDPNGSVARPDTMDKLYRSLLKSLSQAGMAEGVIVGAMPNGIDSLSVVTGKFSPEKTRKRYGSDFRALFADVQKKVRPNGKLREEGLWPRYCRTMLSVAEFLVQFDGVDDFYFWVDKFNSDEHARAGLPLILSEEIFGAGFALACNVLIDLGYQEFAKPDRHVKRILMGAGFISDDASDYQALKSVLRIANLAEVTPYAVDKVLFLIGSGRFYKHSDMAVVGRRDRTRRFLEYLRIQ